MAEPEVPQDELTTMGDVDQAIRALGLNQVARSAILEQADESIRAIKRRAEEAIAPLDERDAQLKASLSRYLWKHRKRLLRRFGKTIRLTNGTVSWLVKARSVDAVEDVRDAIRFVESNPDWDPNLTHVTTLNKDAIATSVDEKLLRGLRRRGVRVSKHEHLNVKPAVSAKTVQLDRRLYPRRR